MGISQPILSKGHGKLAGWEEKPFMVKNGPGGGVYENEVFSSRPTFYLSGHPWFLRLLAPSGAPKPYPGLSSTFPSDPYKPLLQNPLRQLDLYRLGQLHHARPVSLFGKSAMAKNL